MTDWHKAMNKKVNLEITDYGYSGEGVGRNKGKVFFVPYALKDELVSCKIVKETSSFCKARLVEIKNKSDKRINAPCPYFAKCGGCTFQNLNYQDELEIKKQIISNQLKKVDFAGDIEVIASPKEYNYRNKIKLFCNGRSLSLNELESSRLVEIDRCLLVEEEINSVIQTVQTFINAKNIEKDIDNVYIRKQGQNILVWFKFFKPVKLEFGGLQLMLGAECGIYQSLGKAKPGHVMGAKVLSSNEFGFDCEFDVNAFHQVNNEVGQKLYQEVVDSVLGNKVINAYSGAGVLSGILALSGKTVYGVELGQAEHNSAERLKENNKLNKLFNIKGDCAEIIPNLISSDLQSLIVDPPRAGCDKKVCEAINNADVKRVIYISCDSSTLVRDIARMSNFKIKSVKIFDMFPKTSSIEVLCILEK